MKLMRIMRCVGDVEVSGITGHFRGLFSRILESIIYGFLNLE
jgi:hypothetical protein